ncbi:MAG TPA: response regulator [Burkholderiales bacterium]|jgi:FixJ family two-component response regulator|nr:response regulator [Burkholderiales bacterium]
MISKAPIVFVVDDEPSVRKAISRSLGAAGLVVLTFASAQEYLESYDPNAPGCLILDLAMPGFSGLDLQQALAARGGAPPIIFLSGHAEVLDSVQAMKRGAVEFLTKPIEDIMLIDAVRNAVEKDHIDRLLHAELADIQKRQGTLTPREAQVFHHAVAGKLNKQIAAELGTVEKTIKVHRARVMEKMRARSFAELVQLAVRLGITFKAR